MKKVFTLAVAIALLGTASMATDVLAKTATPSTTKATTKPATQKSTMYTCPMHPEVQSKTQGKCPQCGMNLAHAKQEKK